MRPSADQRRREKAERKKQSTEAEGDKAKSSDDGPIGGADSVGVGADETLDPTQDDSGGVKRDLNRESRDDRGAKDARN